MRDIAAADGVGGQDLDSAVPGTPLGCAWSAVPGAAGYQVAFTADGIGYVTSPPWQDASALWLALDAGLALGEEQKYRCAVRDPGSDSSGGCSCRAGAADGPLRSPAGLLALLLLAGLRRAARRAPR